MNDSTRTLVALPSRAATSALGEKINSIMRVLKSNRIKMRVLGLAIAIVLTGSLSALAESGEEAFSAAGASLGKSQISAQGISAEARQNLEYDRLMRLLYNLEALQGKIQVAGIHATLSRPQGFTALAQTSAWCDMKFQGLCYGINVQWQNVYAYHVDDLLKYHRQSISSLEDAQTAARSAQEALSAGSGNSAYSPDTRKALKRLAANLDSTAPVRKAATDYYVSVHKLYAESMSATAHPSGDVTLPDAQGYADVMGRTSSLLQMQLDQIGAAVDRLRAFQKPNGAVLLKDRSALDAALEDPDNIVMLVFGKPGTRAAEVHDMAMQLAEPWEKAFLVTDVSTLTPEERQQWYQGEGSFVTLNLESDWDRLTPEEKKDWRPGNYAKFNVAHAKLRKSWISDFDVPGYTPPSARLLMLAWAKAGCGEQCASK